MLILLSAAACGGDDAGDDVDPSVCRGADAYRAMPLGHDATRVVAADFDGDGLDDLAWFRTDVTGGGDRIGLFFAHAVGDGSFADPTRLTDDYRGQSLQATDMDGDDHADLYFDTTDGFYLYLWQPATSDFVRQPLTAPTLPLDDFTTAADLDGDGNQDLMIGSLANNEPPTIVHGTGVATFDLVFTYSTAIMPDGLVLAFFPVDLTGDGRSELIMFHGGATGTDIGIGVMSASGFGWEAAMFLPHEDRLTRKMLVADVDDDGNVDLLFGRSLYRGQGGLAFGDPEPVLVTDNDLIRDLDGDGELDLVALPVVGGVDLRYGTGPAAFPVSPDHLDGQGNLSVAAGDFDGERGLDLVVDGASGPGGLTVLLSRCEP